MRLTRGDFEQQTVYDSDPLDAAAPVGRCGRPRPARRRPRRRSQRHAGEPRARAADRERGGRAGSGRGRAALARGRRGDARRAERARVVLGTAALRDVDFLDDVLAAHRDHVVVSVDATRRPAGGRRVDRADRDPGRVGDRQPPPPGCRPVRVLEHRPRRDARRPRSRRGRARSPRWCAGRFVYSGGISTLEDLRALAALRQVNLTGVIVGKALYEQRFDVAAAQAALDAADALQARDPVPRRRPRARRQGHRVRRPARRRRPGRARGALRRGRRRRARVPRHHRHVGQPRHGRASSRAGPPTSVFIPFTIGGGIRSVADAQAVLDAGADKVSVNSAALARPELIDELASTFGAQCVVLAIDAKLRAPGRGRPTWPAGGPPPAATPSPGRARGPSAARGRSCSRAWTATGRAPATTWS